MHTEYFLVDYGRYRHAVEDNHKFCPKVYTISSFAFVVEPAQSTHIRGFVVAAQKKNIFRIFYLESQKKAYDFNGLSSVVNIVAKKDVACLRRIAGAFEESEQVGVLSMNVPSDLLILV